MVLAENLVILRNVKGMTQEQVAEVIGISRQSYAKWEQGETMPDIEKCDRLAAFYGIKIDALLHYEEKSRKDEGCTAAGRKIPMGNGQGRKPWADRDPERGKRYVCIKRRRPAGSPRG